MRWAIATWAAVLLASPGAIAQPTSGEVRTLIAPDAAIDAATYRQYQECLARIPLNQDLNRTASARDACRQKAMQHAYRVPPSREQAGRKDDQGFRSIPSATERAAAQDQKLESLRTTRP